MTIKELKERRSELSAHLNEIVGMPRLGWYPGLLGSSHSQIEEEIKALERSDLRVEGGQ